MEDLVGNLYDLLVKDLHTPLWIAVPILIFAALLAPAIWLVRHVILQRKNDDLDERKLLSMDEVEFRKSLLDALRNMKEIADNALHRVQECERKHEQCRSDLTRLELRVQELKMALGDFT